MRPPFHTEQPSVGKLREQFSCFLVSVPFTLLNIIADFKELLYCLSVFTILEAQTFKIFLSLLIIITNPVYININNRCFMINNYFIQTKKFSEENSIVLRVYSSY